MFNIGSSVVITIASAERASFRLSHFSWLAPTFLDSLLLFHSCSLPFTSSAILRPVILRLPSFLSLTKWQPVKSQCPPGVFILLDRAGTWMELCCNLKIPNKFSNFVCRPDLWELQQVKVTSRNVSLNFSIQELYKPLFCTRG